jgi:hypothetical protein
MNTHSKTTSLAVSIVLSTSLISGCATTQQNQQIGGAAFGAIAAGLTTGLLTGNVGYGIAAAAAGAAVGWGAVKLVQYNSRQVRTAEQDRELYGFVPATDKVLIKLNKGYASPKAISPGQEVTIYSDYSLSVPPTYNNQADVTYQWKLIKDGQVLTASEPVVKTKAAAGHQTTQPIAIPNDAEAGTYIVETRLSSGSVYDINEAAFVVK